MIPSFSFLVPTHREDRPLQRCLNSIAPQLGSEDEVLVIGDTYDGPLPMVEHLVGAYDGRFRYLAHDAGHHCYGHCQLNHGLERARGDYLHCNDDDDVWTPGAVQVMRAAAVGTPDRPLLFRFRSYLGIDIWHTRGLVARDHIGGHCLVAPNLPGKVGRFECAYNGDFDMVHSTLMLHGGYESAVWRDEIVCLARPTAAVPV